MSYKGSFKSDSVEFRQIVLKHIQKILEISTGELRNKTVIKNHGNYSETIESEDTRKSYIQSIENLAYILIPYFDDDMQIIYDECEKVNNAFGYEVKKMFKEIYEKLQSELGSDQLEDDFIVNMRLRYSKKLFIALNMLLKRNDYLKTAVYGEASDEIVTEEDWTGSGSEEEE